MLITSGDTRSSIYANIHSNTPKNYTKDIFQSFVTNEMYLMAGESLSKYNYQKKCKIRDSRQWLQKKEIAMTN